MENIDNIRLRIAIQKSGRLSDESLRLLRRCGIKIKQHGMQLFSHCENFPLDILYVRDDDIPGLVMEGICDLGIVGTNVLQEKTLARTQSLAPNPIDSLRALEFGRCRLAIAVPKTFHYSCLPSLASTRIATSYPHLLTHFLQQQQVEAEIIELTGSVEIAPRLDIADVICDLVSTGATLEANDLREVATVFQSEAVLINNTPLTQSQDKQDIIDKLVQRIEGVLKANESKYIMLHAPREAVSDITSILPGIEQPTIVSLESDESKVALHAVCHETIFWDTMERLKAIGASSILVLPIEKMLA